MSFLTSLGLMSGTSMDGIDGAVLVTDGLSLAGFGPTHYRPYSDTEQALLREALIEARGLKDRTARPGILPEAEQVITDTHCEVIAVLLEKTQAKKMNVEVIGFHGQTVVHRPEQHLTVQIGLAQKIADRFKLPVVADFRAADMQAGGQGAPLVPVMHLALAKMAKLALPCAIVNIGGVANVTLIGREENLVAFDTGPGNALINDLMQARKHVALDEGGRAAARGKVDEGILQKLLDDPYFSLAPPKSLDRDHFRPALNQVKDLNAEDAAATLTAFTAASLALALRNANEKLHKVIVAGGGAHNTTLIKELKKRTNLDVVTADALGWSPDSLEAQAFAFLAVRSLRQLPLTFPGTTGVKEPVTGGVVFQPRSG
jgi:anhydro-N-acetylmuramic acid kinase